MVRRYNGARLLLSSLLLGGLLAVTGCEEEKGPLEKAGETADQALQEAAEKTEQAVEEAKEAIDDATKE